MADDTPLPRPIINVAGEKIALGPLDRALLPRYHRWISDFRTLRTLSMPSRPMTLDEETAWFDRAAHAGPDAVVFTIYERATGQPIGTTDLREINHRDRTATFGILIGEAAARGKGYGTEATRLVLDYAFTAIGLHSVMLTVVAFNTAGIRAYERAGFTEFGRRRECWHMGGTLWDIVYMEALASEFESPVLARLFAPDEPRSTGGA